MFYIDMTKNLVIFFTTYVHVHVFAPLTTSVPLQRINLKERTQSSLKVLLPLNKAKQITFLFPFPSFILRSPTHVLEVTNNMGGSFQNVELIHNLNNLMVKGNVSNTTQQ